MGVTARRLIAWGALPSTLAVLSTLCAGALAHPAGSGDVRPAITFGSGHVTGKVTSAATGKPVAGVEVCAEVPGIGYCTRTKANGEYNLGGLPAGEYEIEFAAREQNFAIQYYNRAVSKAQADPVNVPEGVTVPGVNAALQVGAIIKGKITNGATGKALAGILVCATPSGLPNELGRCATSEESGEYTIEQLAAAEYTVQFWSHQDFLGQYYDDRTEAAQANPVTLKAGQLATGIDAAMQPGGEILGTVTGPHGTREEGIEVCAIAAGQEPWQGQCAHTDSEGRYDIAALQGGEYRVAFKGTRGLLTQYYNAKTTLAEAEMVRVTAGSSTSAVDATLGEGARIRGRVTDVQTSAPLEYIEACAEASQGGRVCAGTDAEGDYTIEGLAAGSYAISFQPWSQNYLPEYYGGVRYESEASRVTVAAEATVSGIDAALTPGGEISGTVRDQGTGNPIEDARVCARSTLPPYAFPECVSSGAGGAYTITKLTSGDYSVEFSAPGFAVQYYREAETESEAEALDLNAGTTLSEVNAVLQPGAGISGVVSSKRTGQPLAEAQVCANPTSEGSGACARSNSSGEYTIGGLATSEYVVSFSGAGYPAQYYSGVFNYGQATRVSTTSGHTTGAVDDAMLQGGAIAGSVSAASNGAPLEGIAVCLSPSRGPSSCTQSGAGGGYTISGLTPGLYTVDFGPSAGYLQTSSHKVTVSSETTTAAVNASLQLGGRISGHVTEAESGSALSGVRVCADAEDEYTGLFGTCVETDAQGDYAITGLSSGEWAVEFSPRSEALAQQFFKGAESIEEATSVAVTAGGDIKGIDAALLGGGQIRGVVTNAAGAGLEGVEVCASLASEEPYLRRCAHTDSAGSYSVSALASGRYRVSFSDYSKGFTSQYYPGVYWPISASPVTVVTGAPREGVNATLRTGGKVTGLVSDASTTSPLPGAEVCMREIPPEGEPVGLLPRCTSTDTSGHYELAVFAPGEYEASFSTPNHGFAKQARKLTVAAEATVANVNAAMTPGGKIRGQVTDETGGSIQGAEVCATAIAAERYVGSCARTNAKGEYTITELEAASYEVRFEAPRRDYSTQYYPGVSSASHASPVAIGAGGEATGIDATMKTGGEITGAVTSAAGGEPLEFVFVCALSAAEGESGPSQCASTEANGEYTIVGLPTGEYHVRFMYTGSYAPQYYSNGYLPTEATAVSVNAGSTKAGIDAALSLGGAIRGKVTTAAGGKSIRGARVCATLAGHEHEGAAGCGRSSLNGDYTIAGLDPGSYIVEFSDGAGYRPAFYSGAGSATGATDVPVALGGVSEGIDGALLAASVGIPVNTQSPSITGSPSIGSTLTCSNGTWTGEPPPELSIRWLRDGVPISGAGSAGYVVQSVDEGQQIACEVTATNSSGSTGSTSLAVSIPTGGGEAEGHQPGSGPQSAGPSGSGLSGVQTYRALASPSPVLSGPITTKAGAVYVQLRCPATSGSCLSTTVTVSVVETVVGGRVTAVSAANEAGRRKIKRVLTIASVKVTLAAGRSEDVPVAPYASGRRLLRRWGKLAARVEVRTPSSIVASRIVYLRARRLTG